MIIEIIGKFYDNQSLTIINRELALRLAIINDIYITPLDSLNPGAKVNKNKIKKWQNYLKE